MKRILLVLSALICTAFCLFLSSCSCQHDHKWDEGKIIRKSSETEYGKIEFKCKKCDETKYELIAKLPHEHKYTSPWESDRMSHWHRCDTENCTVLRDKEYHSWDKGTVVKEANHSQTGTKRFVCTACKYVKIEDYRAITTVKEAEWKSSMEKTAFESYTLVYKEGATLDTAIEMTVECTKEKIRYTENGNVTTADNKAGAELGTEEIVNLLSAYKDKFSLFSFDEATRSYFYKDGETIITFQFADGKVSYFCVTTDSLVKAYSFSKIGSTRI